MNEHRDGLVAPQRRVGKMKCERAFAASWSAGKQMRPTVSHPGEPIVEQSDAAANDAANGLSLPSRLERMTRLARWLRQMPNLASSATNPSIHVPRHTC